MSDKPKGPIWVDMSDGLADLSVRKLILVANLALNRLTVRDIGEISYEADIKIDLRVEDRSHD